MKKIKKLIYQSHYRGTKEGDLILAEFAKKVLPSLNLEHVNEYEELLALEDQEIQRWVINKQVVPEKFKFLIEKINNFLKK